MLVALPMSSITGLAGFMTAIDFLCSRLGLAALVAPVAILVGISNVGAAAAYLSSTARLPFVAGINHTCLPCLAAFTAGGRLRTWLLFDPVSPAFSSGCWARPDQRERHL